jgi:hypothetical protein
MVGPLLLLGATPTLLWNIPAAVTRRPRIARIIENLPLMIFTVLGRHDRYSLGGSVSRITSPPAGSPPGLHLPPPQENDSLLSAYKTLLLHTKLSVGV